MLDDADLFFSGTARPYKESDGTDAAALLKQARRARGFSAGSCLPILHRGQLLEISGAPGAGKTRICLSYAIEARLKQVEGDAGVREVDDEREVLLIDTEGGLPADVVYQAALAVTKDESLAMYVIQGIQLARAHSLDHLPALLHSITEILDARPTIALVIIDALSPPLRTHLLPILLPAAAASSAHARPQAAKRPRLSNDQADTPPAMRTHLLHMTRRAMGQLASRQIAIIATVQFASRRREGSSMIGGNERRSSVLKPSLGSVWHASQAWRVTLFADDGGRRLIHWTIVPPAHRKTLSENRQTAYETWQGGVREEQTAVHDKPH